MAKKPKAEIVLVQDPAEANASRAGCEKCALFTNCREPFAPCLVPDGWTGKLLVVTEFPLRGKEYAAISEYLGTAGIKDRDTAFTYANRCRGSNNSEANLTQLRLCRPFLVHDILRLRPTWVIGFGEGTARSISNDGRLQTKRIRQRCFEGVDLLGPDGAGVKIAFTYSLGATFGKTGHEYREHIQRDLRWLVGFKGYKEGPENREVRSSENIGLDIEWGKDYQLITVGRAWDNAAEVTEDKDTWSQWVSEASLTGIGQRIIGHSIFQDLSVIRTNGLPLGSGHISGTDTLCTVLLSRLVNENLGAYDLESLTTSLCNMEPWKSKSDTLLGKQKTKDFWDIPSDIRMERCRLDAWGTAQLAVLLAPKVNPVVLEFTHRLAAMLRRVEMTGVKISPDQYHNLQSIIKQHLDQRSQTLVALASEMGWDGSSLGEFSPSNDNHFRTLLYDTMMSIPRNKTKTGEPSVSEKDLVLLYQDGTEAEKAAVIARLQYKKAAKLYSTYVGSVEDEKGLANHLTENFFVFQRINPLGARTGRRSSNSPNMQNWPKKMRSMVVSRFPNGSIVKGDESQLEPRILAEVAGIEQWQEIFHKGLSLYIEAAKAFWKKDVEKDTPLYKLTKSTILATNYGMEPPLFVEKMSVEQGIHLTLEEGAQILKLYHAWVPALPRFFVLQKERLVRHQQVSTMFGQIRHLPCPDGERTKGFKHLWNQAINFPIQGTASTITGAALLDTEAAILDRVGVSLEEHYDNIVGFWASEKLRLDKLENRDRIVLGREINYPLIINEVHDELVTDTPPDHVKWMPECLKEMMQSVPTLRKLWPTSRSLLLKSEVVTSHSWGG